jgi:hypothetical protein
MNITLDLRQVNILVRVFPRTRHYEAFSILRAVATGVNGPHTPRAVAIARSRIKRAGFTPDSLLELLGFRRQTTNATTRP